MRYTHLMTESLETLPRRRLIPPGEDPPRDELGFLADSFVPSTMGVDELFGLQAVLITGPPWSGKTFLAEQLKKHFRDNSAGESSKSPFGEFLHGTFFETFGQGADIEPHWWGAWQGARARACWIVDAIDEDERCKHRRAHTVLNLVENLNREARERLLLLMFSRENEIPEKVEKRLQEIYDSPGGRTGTRFRILHLAPVDRLIAGLISGSKERFKTVCHLIERNRLQAVAAYPCVIRSLGKRQRGTALTPRDVWQDVVTDMLRDQRRDVELLPDRPTMGDRFNAASRVAAVLTFSGIAEIDRGLGESSSPSIEDIFTAISRRSDELRAGARAALESAVFRRTADGYRFAQFHVQEWFTAFGLQEMPLCRLQPLVADGENGPFPEHRGLLGLLSQITSRDDVRNWIIESHGGVPPRSDAAPLTLRDAIRYLNKLQELAKSTKWGIRPYDDRGFENLKTQGIGDTLARRMADKDLSITERKVIIDVARAVQAKETIPTAIEIVTNRRENKRLRLGASFLLDAVGNDQDLLQLEEFTTSLRSSSWELNRLLSNLIDSFYRRGLWTWLEAALVVPDAHDYVLDTTSWLVHRLEEDMNLERARQLLKEVPRLPAVLHARKSSKERGSRDRRGRKRLLRKALELLSSQSNLVCDDYELLQPLALTKRRPSQRSVAPHVISQLFVRDRDARRTLFAEGLRRDVTGKGEHRSAWCWVPQGEDLDWLMKICEKKAEKHQWLWDVLLATAYRPGVTRASRNRARKCVLTARPGLLVDFDKRRRQLRGFDKRDQAREQRRDEEEVRRTFGLAELVSDTLTNSDVSLHERMARLSWFCFSKEHEGPTNVRGEWGDIDLHLQQQVFALCERALCECNPTPIPGSGSFPSSILYEAAAFIKVAESSATFELDTNQIKKWLPAAIFSDIHQCRGILAMCARTDRDSTDGVLLDAILREMRSGRGDAYTAANLPAEFWSERLARSAAKLLEDADCTLSARGQLLRLVARNASEYIARIAKEWANAEIDDEDACREMRYAGLDALLITNPEEGVSLLAERTSEEGQAILLAMSSLQHHHWGPSANVSAWKVEQLEKLLEVLFVCFPRNADPQRGGGAYSVGPDDELRELRDRIPRILFDREGRGDHAALERLARKIPDVKVWLDYVRANRGVSNLVSYLTLPTGPTDRNETTIPVKQVVRLLEDALYRLIRSSADLQRVLTEELREIARSAKSHLSMLYRTKRKRLREAALQAYIHCRLNDRLPGRVLDVETQAVFINREALASKDQRLDLKVQSPTLSGESATVVIEIKWSDNAEVSTSLCEQLGEEYLFNENLTRGIYLVGWNERGTWRQRNAVKRPHPIDSLEAWQMQLEKQAAEFRKNHKNISIEPLIIDLRWNRRRS